MDTAREVKVYYANKAYDCVVAMLFMLRKLKLSSCEYQYAGMKAKSTPWGDDALYGVHVYLYRDKMS
jgi:hypothetical protein